MIDWIIEYRQTNGDSPVRSQVQPGYIAGDSSSFPLRAPVNGEPWSAIRQDIDDVIRPGLTHWESPNFFAYFKPTSSFPSVLGDLLAAGINVMGFSWISRCVPPSVVLRAGLRAL